MSGLTQTAIEIQRGSVGLGVRFVLGWSLGLVGAVIAMTIKLI